MNKRLLPVLFLLPLVLFAAVVYAALLLLLKKTGGNLIYVIDDPYIHLSMASHLVREGVWGVSVDSFSNSSSSPLWTLLLAPFTLFPSITEKAPFALNLAAIILLSFLLWKAALREGLSGVAACVFPGAVLFLTPLTVLPFTGMEHALHALLVMLFVLEFTQTGGAFSSAAKRSLLIVCMVLARTESLFVIVPAVVLTFDSRYGKRFAGIAVAALIPVVALGVFSLLYGGLFFPNSVALKGNSLGISSVTLLQFLGKALKQIISAPHLVGLMIVSFSILVMHRKSVVSLKTSSRHLHVIFLAAALLHLLFAQVGWFYRYEAYLMVMGFSALFLSLPEWRPVFANPAVRTGRKHAARIFMVLLTALLAGRSISAVSGVPLSAKNIHEQQYQVGLFLRENAAGRAVVVNDIGASSFLGNVRIIDLYGLGSDEIARMRKTWRFTVNDLEGIVKKENALLAVVDDSLFFETGVFKFARPFFEKIPFLSFLKSYFIKNGIGPVPAHWIKVAEWTIPDNIICESGTVSFYAFNPGDAAGLLARLRAFEPRLPPGIVKTYFSAVKL